MELFAILDFFSGQRFWHLGSIKLQLPFGGRIYTSVTGDNHTQKDILVLVQDLENCRNLPEKRYLMQYCIKCSRYLHSFSLTRIFVVLSLQTRIKATFAPMISQRLDLYHIWTYSLDIDDVRTPEN